MRRSAPASRRGSRRRTARTSASPSPTAHPATRPAPSLPASRRTSSSCRPGLDIELPGPGRPRRCEVEQAVGEGHRDELDRRVRRPRRQPEEDQELERPREAGRRDRDPEPALVRRREVERDGCLREPSGAREDRPTGDRMGRADVQKHRLPRHLGRNATNAFLAGRGDVFITYENEARLAKLQYVIPRQTLLIEAPIAVIKTSENPRLPRTGSSASRRAPPPSGSSRSSASGPLVTSVYQGVRQAVPEATGHLQDRGQVHRGLEGRRQAVVRPGQRRLGRDREARRRQGPRQTCRAPRRSRRPSRAHPEGEGKRPLPRLRRRVPLAHPLALPMAALIRARRRRARRASGRWSRARSPLRR